MDCVPSGVVVLFQNSKLPFEQQNSRSYSSDHLFFMETAKGVTGPDAGAVERASIKVVGNEATCPADQKSQHASSVIAAYLMEIVVEFRKVADLREKATLEQGWSSKKGDKYFRKQRRVADNADEKTAWRFFNMMKEIGEILHLFTDAFRISRDSSERPVILDMCMAPGGFLAKALSLNHGAHAVAFSLPSSKGGHKVLLESPDVGVKFLDITMLAADMGVTDIPAEHPDAEDFLRRRQFNPGQSFDLILCDGQVLRTHVRASYREGREARRLTITQLALGLQHIRQGGTMVVLLHKVEEWHSVFLLYTFSKFSSVKVFKPKKYHAIRSSFYMVATNIQSQHPEALLAVKRWKAIWKAATFGTDEEYGKTLDEEELGVETVLAEFGSELVRLGKDIWWIQARALRLAPFTKTMRVS
ncbi:hypothetical protein FQN55_007975 [Onygenales sp. PD_40]|nr:hypothetical protein FQN55_007975 [Onygenales sp. PD_40]